MTWVETHIGQMLGFIMGGTLLFASFLSLLNAIVGMITKKIIRFNVTSSNFSAGGNFGNRGHLNIDIAPTLKGEEAMRESRKYLRMAAVLFVIGSLIVTISLLITTPS